MPHLECGKDKLTTNVPFDFRFTAKAGKSYTVEATGNLLRWNKVETIQGTGSAVQFTDTRKALEEADKPRRPCNKRFRLALWWLTYRLPVLDGVNKETEELARKHCKYSEADWARDREDFQSQWERMLSKRERRFRWYQKRGKVPDGWTPPDPNDPHSRKYPKRALAATLPKKYRMFWPVLLDRPDYELMEEIG